ncbi:precorrin-4 C(11)-methyltransferase [Desulfovibrio sp. OttesenSCG-928-F20]|nr:precorrin-4 C(11)-methyltransferase [Desulfovibrio sp. OttesenSCG-928-F20]
MSAAPPGRVYFIGAGPGDPDLITVKGRRLIEKADLVLYAGSLVPRELVACARKEAQVIDSSGLTLENGHDLVRKAALQGGLVARVHTGDPMLYGAVREQMLLLDGDGIAYEVVPGVSALFAAAAAARVSLTVPDAVQSLAVTRMDGRTRVPKGQRVADYAAHGGSLAVYLSGAAPGALAQDLLVAGVAGDCPVLIAHKVGWPDECLIWSTVANLERDAAQSGFERQVLYLVLPGEKADKKAASRLYDPDFSHGFRQ